jgi:hypothetical protein
MQDLGKAVDEAQAKQHFELVAPEGLKEALEDKTTPRFVQMRTGAVVIFRGVKVQKSGWLELEHGTLQGLPASQSPLPAQKKVEVRLEDVVMVGKAQA